MGTRLTFDIIGYQRDPAPEHEGVHVTLMGRHRVARITGWGPARGFERSPIERTRVDFGEYHVALDGSGDFIVEYPMSAYGNRDRYFRITSDGDVEIMTKHALEREWRASARVGFGELRSEVARAAQLASGAIDDGGASARAAWSAALVVLDHLDHPGERQAGVEYLRDHATRALESQPMARLDGTGSQSRWAKKIRLRCLQRLGVATESDETTQATMSMRCLVAKLIARTHTASGYWIGKEQLVYKGEVTDLIDELTTMERR